jgi:hypothetical protein
MRVVEAEIITCKVVGNVAFIPRIKFISDNSDLPFTFTRKQFPLRLTYRCLFTRQGTNER